MKKETTTTPVLASSTSIKSSKNTAQSKSFNPANFVRPGVNEAQISQIKAAFDLFDTDQGGTIDTNQLKAAMVSLGFDTKNAVIFQMISDLDEDGNKLIDFEEWIHLMTYRFTPASTKESIRKVFPLYDDEKTDHISVKNLRRVALDLNENISEQQLQQMIERADLDKDGLVSFQQFYEILTRKIKD